jgi:hypothetical protein
MTRASRSPSLSRTTRCEARHVRRFGADAALQPFSARRIIHTGRADEKAFRALTDELHRYADSRASIDEARIQRAKRKRLGPTREKVLKRILGRRLSSLTRATMENAYDLAEGCEDVDGPPNTYGEGLKD